MLHLRFQNHNNTNRDIDAGTAELVQNSPFSEPPRATAVIL